MSLSKTVLETIGFRTLANLIDLSPKGSHPPFSLNYYFGTVLCAVRRWLASPSMSLTSHMFAEWLAIAVPAGTRKGENEWFFIMQLWFLPPASASDVAGVKIWLQNLQH